MTSPTFTKAMQMLVEEGFIEISRPSGTFDGKGIKQLYSLSGLWKTREYKKKGNPNIREIR
jgi:DNA-binding transcriptional regulator YhcF (GntR family)